MNKKTLQDMVVPTGKQALERESSGRRKNLAGTRKTGGILRVDLEVRERTVHTGSCT